MRRTTVLMAIAIAVLVSACTSGPVVRALFVGNSYTASNDLPGMVRSLGDSVGMNLQVETVAPGGWWLRDHLGSNATLDAIAAGDFDFVVLQEQSMVPADHRLAMGESMPAAVALATRINQSGARPVAFMTWAHRNGSREVGHSSFDSMQIAIADTYERMGEAIAGPVAPVGAAWWMALAERPDIIIFQSDGSHPTVAGSYLAAAVIAGTLLDIDPADFDDDLGVEPGEASALRGFAARAVGGERPWG